MTKTLIALAILALIIYCYQQKKETKPAETNQIQTELDQVKQVNQTLTSFLRDQLNSNSLEELKTKLNGKTLNEILEQNEDWETEVDSLTRSKNSLEQDLLAQSNAFQNRLREKDREVKKLKEDLKLEKTRADKLQQNLTSEKQQHKGSIERINLLTQQVQELTKQHQNQLKAINLLFDPKAKDYSEIDFNGLYELLKGVAKNE